MLLFKNKGEIDVRCINTFGASSKAGDKDDGIFGMFGTGLKYAIAILLREGKEIEIWSGNTRCVFTSERITLQRDEFDVVHMNGEALSFTTELGKTWELWQAYRELYCNAADEKGETFLIDAGEDHPRESEICLGIEGETRIYVKGMDHIFNAGYILSKDLAPLETSYFVEVYAGESDCIYYQGVRVMKLQKPSLYTYNIQHAIDLTEDRTAKFHWQVENVLCHHFAASKDLSVLENILIPPNGVQDFESRLDFSQASPSEKFRDTVNRLHESMKKPNWSAVKICMRNEGDELPQVSVELDNLEQGMLDKALGFCKKIGYALDEWPIIIVEDLGKDILARASNGNIYISKRLFKLGTKHLVAGLIEEAIHLKTGYSDYSLSLQTYLFEEIVSMGERIIGEAL